MRVARRAGSHVAVRATETSTNCGHGEGRRIQRRDAVDHRADQSRGDRCGCDTNQYANHRRRERLRHHQPYDVAPCRTQRDANPNLFRALDDRVRGHSIDPDRRHHERRDGKQPEQERAVTLGTDRPRHSLIHRGHLGDHDVGIDRPDLAVYRRCAPERVATGRAKDERERRPCDVTGGHLRERCHHQRFGDVAKRAVGHIGRQADDRKPLSDRGDSRANDVAAGGEAALEGLVHDHDALGTQPIAPVEIAASHHGNAHRAKVPGRHKRNGRGRLGGRISSPVHDDVRQARGGSCERSARHGAGRGHARYPLEAVSQVVEERGEVTAVRPAIRAVEIARSARRDAHRQQAIGLEPAVLPAQVPERLDQQRRADDQHERHRDLRRQHDAADRARCCHGGRAAGEDAGQADPRGTRDRRQAAQHPGADRNRDREREHPPVELDRVDVRRAHRYRFSDFFLLPPRGAWH